MLNVKCIFWCLSIIEIVNNLSILCRLNLSLIYPYDTGRKQTVIRNVAIISCIQYFLNFLGYVTFICYCSMKARAHVSEFSQTIRSTDGNSLVKVNVTFVIVDTSLHASNSFALWL